MAASFYKMKKIDERIQGLSNPCLTPLCVAIIGCSCDAVVFSVRCRHLYAQLCHLRV